jgi:hypothetical protein
VARFIGDFSPAIITTEVTGKGSKIFWRDSSIICALQNENANSSKREKPHEANHKSLPPGLRDPRSLPFDFPRTTTQMCGGTARKFQQLTRMQSLGLYPSGEQDENETT